MSNTNDNNELTELTKQFYEQCEFIVLTSDKRPDPKFNKTLKYGWSFKDVINQDNLGIKIPDPYVVMDVDDEHEARSLYKIAQAYKWKTRILQTTKGIHLWFTHNTPLKNWVKKVTPLGIKVDIRSYGKQGFVMIKKDGQWRQWLQFDEQVDNLPKEISPLELLKPSIAPAQLEHYLKIPSAVNLSQGSRRDNLFQRNITLLNADFNISELYNLYNVINRFMFASPLPTNEVQGVLSGLKDKPIEQVHEQPYGEFLTEKKRKNLKELELLKWLLTQCHLRNYANQIYIYEDGVYVLNTKQINKIIYNTLPDLSARAFKAFMEFLSLSNLVQQEDKIHETYISLKDCLFNTKTLTTTPHNPSYFVVYKINATYDPFAESIILNKFMNDITQNNQERVDSLYEFLGYCLTPLVNRAKALFLYGYTASNGKSTFLQLVRLFLNNSNISAVSLRQFEDKFAPASLLNKMVNIDADIDASYLRGVDVFKNLITGDEITAELKFRDSFTFANTAKLIFAANSLPPSNDKTQGYFRRLLIIPFNAQFKDNANDVNIIHKLNNNQVMNALFNYAVQGLIRLNKFGKFSAEKESTQLVNTYYKRNNSVLQWLEMYTFTDKKLVQSGLFLHDKATQLVYDEYKDWCSNTNNKAVKYSNFYDELSKCFNGLITERVQENNLSVIKFFIRR